MKTTLHYFSATGNTARAVHAIADRLAAAGHEVSFQAVDGRTALPKEIPDLTILAFPILSWSAPHFVLDYARRLPKAIGARAAVFATCGGFGAQGVGEVARALRRRGYRVECSGEARYPDNWTMAQNPPTGDTLAQALAKGDQATILFANSIVSEHPTTFQCAFIHQVWSWPISVLFRSFGRRFLGKTFVADAQCTSCGLCASGCPVQAIRMIGTPSKPRWNASCSGCYRCINLCPAKAIQISVPLMIFHLGLNLALTILCLGAIGWIQRQLPPMPGALSLGMAVVMAIAVLMALTAFQLTAVDDLLYGLATRASWRGFFLRNYTQRFGRYRAPGFRIGADGQQP